MAKQYGEKKELEELRDELMEALEEWEKEGREGQSEQVWVNKVREKFDKINSKLERLQETEDQNGSAVEQEE